MTYAFDPNQKRGHVTNAGRWSAYEHTAPEASLATRAIRIVGEADLVGAINERFPQPQANSLEKVSCVTDAVFAGANTTESIAEALDVHHREGEYYSAAAGYLGLVEPVDGEPVVTFALTSLGQKFCIASEEERVTVMRALVAQAPGVQVLEDEGWEALTDYLMETGLGEATARRRAETIRSWREALATEAEFAGAAHAELMSTGGRALTAAQHAEQARHARVEALRRIEPVAVRCGSCGMQVPLSGVCDYC